MLINFFKSLKKSLLIWTFAFALLPTYLMSSYLIDEFQRIQINEQIEKLKFENLNVAQAVEFELQLLSAQMIQASQDADVALAAYAGVFGAKARVKLKQLGEQHTMLSAVMLIDKSGAIAEAAPSKAELLNIDDLLATINELPKDHEHEQKLYIKRLLSASLSESLFTHKVTNNMPIDDKEHSEQVFVFISSLIFTESESVNTGYLVGIVPIDRLYTNWQGKLPKSQLVNLTLDNNTLIDRREKLSDKFIEVKTQVTVNKQTLLNNPTVKSQAAAGQAMIIHANVARDKSEALTQVNALVFEFKIVTITILFIILLVNIFIIRHILRPLNKLSKVITAYADGNFSGENPRFFFKEMNQIIYVLAKMARRIQDNQAELESRVVQRTKDLQLAYNDLENTNKQLKLTQNQLVESEKMSQLGQLVAGVAHEINTPVGIAVTASTAVMDKIDLLAHDFAQGVLTKSTMEEVLTHNKQCIDLIYNNLKRASKLIQTFKEVSIDQSNESRRTFNLYDYIHEVVASLQPELKHYQVAIEISGDENFALNSYPGTFGQLITNFIMNSLKHAFDKAEQHTIKINFIVCENAITLRYQDDGVGIATANVPKIFEAFYTTKRNNGGTGLGLNIVYNLVTQKLKGTIKCQSDIGQGIDFTMQIPKVLPR